MYNNFSCYKHYMSPTYSLYFVLSNLYVVFIFITCVRKTRRIFANVIILTNYKNEDASLHSCHDVVLLRVLLSCGCGHVANQIVLPLRFAFSYILLPCHVTSVFLTT